VAFASCVIIAHANLASYRTVGPVGSDEYLTPTGQYVKPAGEALVFFGRPSDLAFAPNHRLLAVKNSHGLVFIDPRRWLILQTLPLPPIDVDFAKHLGGDGPAGIVWSADGKEVWTTDSFGWIHGARIGSDGRFSWADKNGTGSDSSAPIGLTLGEDGRTLFVALSREDAVAAIDTTSHRVDYRLPVGNAPFGVLRIGGRLYVSNWAGRRSDGLRSVADSSGTPIRVDPMTGAASSGSVSVVDIARRRVVANIDVGLHPSTLIASADGSHVYVANSSSDTVSIIDTAEARVARTISLDASEPFGRTPTALALSGDGKMLYVAEGGADDVAAISLSTDRTVSRVAAGWYPVGLACYGSTLYVANLKGIGSRATEFSLGLPAATITQRGGTRGYNVYDYAGLVQRVTPRTKELKSTEWLYTQDNDTQRVLRRFKHVLYIIAENHTYDDYFGDVSAGNGDFHFCAFCGKISTNHHALAARFGLFDNFYVNSILSADGHNWTDEGYASDYVERGLSGWGRSYPSAGNDAMAYSPKGFIWNAILAHGLTFRDYGEFFPDITRFEPPNPSWTDFYADYRQGRHRHRWVSRVEIASLRPFVDVRYPSFSLRIPDQIRASAFLTDLHKFEATGQLPNLMLMSLPGDHTAGTDPGRPTPRAYVADNDLALGRIVSAMSRSRFWNDTVIFVVEDDAQDGLDHVDGHRTMALVISAYQKSNRVYHEFYDQTSVLHTIEDIFGIPPMTRFDAHANAIITPFGAPHLQPYDVRPNEVPLDELNPQISSLSGIDRVYALESEHMDFEHSDRTDGARMAQIIRRSTSPTRAGLTTLLQHAAAQRGV
jgi:YVTN family beta-propeller protein